MRARGVIAATVIFLAAVLVVTFRPQVHELAIGGLEWLKPAHPEDMGNPGMRVVQAAGQMLTLDSTGKYFVNTITHKPVFLTGDSPQQLATELCAADVDHYLADRQNRGFNALWVYVADNIDQSKPPKNCAGDVPFNGTDFTNFNEKYWSYVDSVIAKAEKRGLIVFIEPGFVGQNAKYGYFHSYSTASSSTMKGYGTFLGNRYKGYSNVVWSLGGDADPAQKTIYANLATLAVAIQKADPNHLITFEACRATCAKGNDMSSLDALPGPPNWLGINWVYNTRDTVIAGCQRAWKSGNPIMPPIMGEDWYELERSLTSFEVRQEGYWAILSGCYGGRLFGNAAIYGFNSPNSGVTTPKWKTELDSVGSISQVHMGELFRSRQHWKLEPDINHKVVTAGYGSGLSVTTTARTREGQSIIAYVPNGHSTTLTVDMSKITSKSSLAKAWWFNPSNASTRAIGQFKTSGKQQFTAPDGKDWVLVIDDKAAKLPAPGTKDL